MAGKVIQGNFIGGRPSGPAFLLQHSAALPPAGLAGRNNAAQAKQIGRPPGPAEPAFAARPSMAQAHGADGSFQVDPTRLGLGSGGNGRLLPDLVRGKMEAALGADFSAVRVHVGPQAERIGAVAFAIGSDIYFAPGRFQPDTVQGQQLLGHELAHVVQQRQGRVRNPIGSGVAVVQDRALEAEAERLGHRAATHRMAVQAKTAASASQPSAAVRISPPISAGPGSYRLTAGSGGRQIGSVMVHARDKAAVEITDLGVDPAHRAHGVGKMLLASAARTGLRAGKAKVTLAAQDNGSGHLTRWYKDMGFAQVGVSQHGHPRMEAPIGRVLAGAVQRQPAPPRPRHAPPASPLVAQPRFSPKMPPAHRPAVVRQPGGDPQVLQPAGYFVGAAVGAAVLYGLSRISWSGRPRPAAIGPRSPLADLAQPAVVTLPQQQILAQDVIAAELNRVIEHNGWAAQQILGLGMIELPAPRYGKARLLDALDVPIQLRSLGTLNYRPFFKPAKPGDIALEPDMRAAIVNNVLVTMERAGQLAYLTQRGLPDDNWAVVVEVHYYYSRPPDSIVFHKDTLGDTLFVNLNYLNDDEIPGPEYVLNPDPVDSHSRRLADNLPGSIRGDIDTARQQLPRPTTIGATRIPRRGVVTFVDELIYHATPIRGRRTVRGRDVAAFVQNRYYRWWGDASRAREAMRGARADQTFNMDQVRTCGLGLTEAEIRTLFEQYADGGRRTNASIPGGRKPDGNQNPGVSVPLSGNRPPLTRTMSTWAINDQLPRALPAHAKRQFFRTWVRVIRRDRLGGRWNREGQIERAAFSSEGTHDYYMGLRGLVDSESKLGEF